MILYVFCTTLPGPLSLISSTASHLYAYMFFFKLPGDSFTTSWPEIGTIRTLPNPHRGWSRHCPQHIIVPSAALRKMIGPWLKVCCQCEAEKNWGSWHPSTTYPAEASPWMTWCRGWCPMKKTQVAPILMRFNPWWIQISCLSLDPWLCTAAVHAVSHLDLCSESEYAKTHENSWKFMIPNPPDSDSQDQPLTGKCPKSYYKHQAEVRGYKWHLSKFPNFSTTPKSGSSEFQIFSPLTQPGVSEPDSSSLCETCGIPLGKSWLISGWFPSKAI